MTMYIAAYDVESEDCLAGVRRLVELHEQYGMPATFFIIARLLDGPQGNEYRRLLGDSGRLEIASHSYTHMMLRENRRVAPAGSSEQFEREIVGSKRRIEEHFGRTVVGFRTPCGFCQGLRGEPGLLGLLAKAGYRYSSSLAWGPDETLPALIEEPFRYAEDGFAELWEIPPCGWHENVLKGTTPLDRRALQPFPHPMPEAFRADFVKTPQEEFEVHRLFIDRAGQTEAGHVSLIWHPWSLHAFDPKMEMVERVFQYVRELGLPVGSFAEYLKTLPGAGA